MIPSPTSGPPFLPCLLVGTGPAPFSCKRRPLVDAGWGLGMPKESTEACFLDGKVYVLGGMHLVLRIGRSWDGRGSIESDGEAL